MRADKLTEIKVGSRTQRIMDLFLSIMQILQRRRSHRMTFLYNVIYRDCGTLVMSGDVGYEYE